MQKSSENKTYKAIGLMSGTAMDGIDAALIETDGYDHVRFLGFESKTHDTEFREQLKSCLNEVECDRQIEREFTLRHIPVIQNLLESANLSANDIDVIGFHGQTTHHDPDQGVTVQMGDDEILAEETGIDVVYDFRSNDMKAGGQGAPFLPVYHRALAMKAGLEFPIIVLNLGGVGNITWISDDHMVAFDTGPANAMIDDLMIKETGWPFDQDGKTAAKGQTDQGKVDQFLSLDYFLKKYPKSLDRNDFNNIDVSDLSFEDGIRTLSEMTVQSVAKGVEICPSNPSAIYVTGGGRHNGFIMQRLSEVTGLPVHSVDSLGWNGDAMEAQGFAYMAVKSILGESISFPGTTGCDHPTVGGMHVTKKAKAA